MVEQTCEACGAGPASRYRAQLAALYAARVCSPRERLRNGEAFPAIADVTGLLTDRVAMHSPVAEKARSASLPRWTSCVRVPSGLKAEGGQSGGQFTLILAHFGRNRILLGNAKLLSFLFETVMV